MADDLQQFIGEYTKQINLEENAKGIYFLEIETNDGAVEKRIEKKKKNYLFLKN